MALLIRTSRSVALTDAGKRLLETAGPAVDQALESLKTITAQPGEVRGRVRVRITVPTSAGVLILAKLLPVFIVRHPNVEVDIAVDDRFVDIVSTTVFVLLKRLIGTWCTSVSSRPAA